jgi:hypothetical protein
MTRERPAGAKRLAARYAVLQGGTRLHGEHLADTGHHSGRGDHRARLWLVGVAAETARAVTSDNRKPWDARLVEWMQRGSRGEQPSSLRQSILAGIVGGLAGGRLAEGTWWPLATMFGLAVVYRMVRWAFNDHTKGTGGATKAPKESSERAAA